MRVKLYKYTPHIDSFIENPMLKCTSACELNDPFELKPTSKLANEFVNVLDPNYIYHSTENEVDIRTQPLGVISLSESKFNILMWSHYADEHRGGVVEFSFDLEYKNNNILQRGLFEHTADNQYVFNRVKYVLERNEVNANSEYSQNSPTQELRINLAFCKADSWAYEKEHRFLCATNNSDRVLINVSENVDQDEVVKILDDMKIDILGINSKWVEIDPKKNSNFIVPYSLNDALKASKSSLMHFYEVRVTSVTGLYFGCKFPQDKFNEIIAGDRLNKFVNLKDNALKATLSKNVMN